MKLKNRLNIGLISAILSITLWNPGPLTSHHRFPYFHVERVTYKEWFPETVPYKYQKYARKYTKKGEDCDPCHAEMICDLKKECGECHGEDNFGLVTPITIGKGKDERKIVSFEDLSIQERHRPCLRCHGQLAAKGWFTSAHGGDVSCGECHEFH